MIPLIGFAAISIDVAAMWAERQQLQTGADAAAVGVAQDCARGRCGNAAGTAAQLTTGNVTDGHADAQVSGLDGHAVTVTTSGVRSHLFAPVLGIRSSTIVAHASAGWGAPTGGTAVLPVALSWCDYQARAGGGSLLSTDSRTILLPAEPVAEPDTATPGTDAAPPPAVASSPPPTTQDPDGRALPTTAAVPPSAQLPAAPPTCAGPRGNLVPQGFGWLDTDGGCRARSSIADGATSSGVGLLGARSVPSGCSVADLADLRGRAVLVPVFDERTGVVGPGHYRVYGYAAFVLTGYHFGASLSSGSPCSGPTSCVSGYFTSSVDLSDDFTYDSDAPELGAAVVSLTQ